MWFVVLGLFAGVLSGLFGIGGGIVIVPALLLFFKMKAHMATGTSLAALVLPVGIFGALNYYKQGAVNLNGALLIAAGLAVGAFIGAKVAYELPVRVIQRAFAIFIVLAAVQIWRKS
jgi:hypothetical protein